MSVVCSLTIVSCKMASQGAFYDCYCKSLEETWTACFIDSPSTSNEHQVLVSSSHCEVTRKKGSILNYYYWLNVDTKHKFSGPQRGKEITFSEHADRKSIFVTTARQYKILKKSYKISWWVFSFMMTTIHHYITHKNSQASKHVLVKNGFKGKRCLYIPWLKMTGP